MVTKINTKFAAGIISLGTIVSGCMGTNKNQAYESSLSTFVPSVTTSTSTSTSSTSTSTTTIPTYDNSTFEGVRFFVTEGLPLDVGMVFKTLETTNPSAWTGVVDNGGNALLEYTGANISVSLNNGIDSTWLVNNNTAQNEGHLSSTQNGSQHYTGLSSQTIAPDTNVWMMADSQNNRRQIRINTPESSVVYIVGDDGKTQRIGSGDAVPSFVKSVEGTTDQQLKTLIFDSQAPYLTAGIDAVLVQTDNGAVVGLNLESMRL